MRFTHAFKGVGVQTITVTAHNKIGSIKVETNVNILSDVKDLLLETNGVITNPPGTVPMTLYTSTNEHLVDILCDWTFENGQKSTDDIEELSFTKRFSKSRQLPTGTLGDHIISVNCSNKLSFSTARVDFAVEESVGDISLSLSKTVIKKNEAISFSTSLISGSHLLLTINFGDGFYENIPNLNKDGGPFTHSLTHKYTQTGHFTVSVVAKNQVSVKQYTHQIDVIVQNIVKDLELLPISIVAIPTGSLNVNVKVTTSEDPPTEVTCKLELDAKDVVSLYISRMSPASPSELIFSSLKELQAGDHYIRVKCSNLVSNQNIQASFTAERIITGVAITPDSVHIPEAGTVNFNVVVGEGSHISAIFDFGLPGVAKDEQTFQANNINGVNYALTKTYTTAGFYKTKLVVKNSVSEGTASTIVNVYEKIEGLHFEMYYVNSGTERSGHGQDNNIYPMDEDIYLKASVDKGNGIVYDWKFGDGNAIKTTEYTTSHRYTTEGEITVVLNASNPFFYETKTVTFTIHQVVRMYLLENDGPKTIFSLVTMTVHNNRPGTLACYEWDLGDGSPRVVYGEQQCDPKDTNKIYKMYVPTETLTHKHTYTKKGVYDVKISAVNVVSSDTISASVVIDTIDCEYPDVSIKGNWRNPDFPLIRLRSEWINLESHAIIDCPVSPKASYSWKVEKFQENRMTGARQDYSFTHSSSDRFQMSFPPRTFLAWSYIITLNVSMDILPAIHTADSMYMKIQPTPLSVKIVGGTARSVGYNKDVTLDAMFSTYDPDVERSDKSGFTFTWYCRKIDEELPMVDGEIDPTIKVIPPQDEKDKHAQSGCFRNGPGRLSFSNGVVTIDTFMMEPESINLFRVDVRKGDKYGTFQQAVSIVAGDPPSIDLR